MSDPQYRYPHPMRPDEPIVIVQWHVASASDDEVGISSPLAPEWWDGVTEEERKAGMEKLRAIVAREVAGDLGRPVPVSEISYTVHRRGEAPVRPDEEPT